MQSKTQSASERSERAAKIVLDWFMPGGYSEQQLTKASGWIAESYAETEAKVERLCSRGIEDMRHRIDELEAALTDIVSDGTRPYWKLADIATEALDGR